jgi:hypothetical protein
MAYKQTVSASYGVRKRALTPRADFSAVPPLPTAPTAATPRLRTMGGYSIPTFDTRMTFSDIGSSGLRQFSGWVREEFLPQLAGREAARVYREMLDNSSVVGSIMFAINATLRKIEWRVEPGNDSPDGQYQAEFIEGCMNDMSHTWSDFVQESLSMLGYGFAPHELVYKRSRGRRPGNGQDGRELPRSQFDDGMIRWRRMPLRGQDTILKWFFGDNGEILGMTQQPWTGPIVDIPIEKMVLFRASVHKGNPEGRSILRTAYRSYYLGKRMEELESILFERMGGIPVVSVPKQLLDLAAEGDVEATKQVETWKRIATNVRVDEQMGLIIPSDLQETGGTGAGAPAYKFELVTPAGGRGQAVDSDKAITRYNVNMLSSILADFIQLGHESRGTQALAVSKTDMFFQAMDGFLGANADVLNRHGIPRLCDLNGLDPEGNPNIKPDMPQRLDLDTLSNFILRLQQAGMPLFPNDTLQEFILDAAGMPDVTDDPNYELLSDLKTQQLQAGADAALQAAQNGGTDEPQGKTNLEKAIAAAVARRVLKIGGSAATYRLRKRRRRA